MNKEKFYTGIKNTMYRKFNELEVVKSNDGNYIYLKYKNDGYAQVVIYKELGLVNYYCGFIGKFFKLFPMTRPDFEVLLSRWVKDTFKIKMKNASIAWRKSSPLLKIPLE